LCAAIRLEGNHTGNAKPRLANLELIADLQSRNGEDLRIDPGLADLRPARREFVRLRNRACRAQPAAQRVASLNRLDRGQLQCRTRADHGRKLPGRCRRKPSVVRLAQILGRHWRIGLKDKIGAQHLGSVALERAAHAIGQEAHAGHCGDGHDHGQRKQAQITGTRVAPDLPQGNFKYLQMTVLPSQPADRLLARPATTTRPAIMARCRT